ncbi:ParA family protein [Candidatus Arthromitus sp. SFB-rat-Yit]|uniref:ParA family protein n=1 Tax=Candidatus Arthromitus sp. SFB-rat-Yit TaxID=1041504 RepID=UPI000227A853|nr:ParA family protein [Candidatus Arthromitus sp. SFB-rat-Yit]BAK81898.1 sporulation initiation inhibitor protein soj [Candidatus Arthromitus sp. SFB-rat-Yit]
MKKICVFNQKGGVGKTTTNINLASYLALEGFKILVVDMDPQGNASSGLGIDKNNLNSSIYDLFVSDKDLNSLIIESDIIKNLYIVPSSINLAAAEVELANMKNREFLLKDSFSKLNGFFDFVFIDCPPSLGFLSLNSLVASDSLIIPIQCEFYALEGLSQLINTISLVNQSLNKKLYIEGVILNMFDSRANLSNEVVSEVNNFFEDKVYSTIIPRNIKLAESPSYGLPIMLYDEKCKGAISYKNLAKEFICRQRRSGL